MKRPGLVLDTSVAVKWFSQRDEGDLPQALALRERLREGEIELFVPDLFFVELANALRFNARFSSHDVEAALESLWAMQLGRLDVTLPILRQSVRLAFAHKITVYDAAFLALAQQAKMPLLTADEAFYRKLPEGDSAILLRHFPNPAGPEPNKE